MIYNEGQCYCLHVYPHKLAIGWVKKTTHEAMGFIAVYGGGHTFGKVVYLRVCRLIIGLKLYKQYQHFEWYFPKNYILNKEQAC